MWSESQSGHHTSGRMCGVLGTGDGKASGRPVSPAARCLAHPGRWLVTGDRPGVPPDFGAPVAGSRAAVLARAPGGVVGRTGPRGRPVVSLPELPTGPG